MGTSYTVVKGDCLSSIAHRFGFADYRTIYDAPENAGFKAARPDPNLIYPGDLLIIPDKTPNPQGCATGQRHKFQLAGSDVRLRIVIKDDDGTAIAGKKYRLTLDSLPVEGTTGGDGMIDVPISAEVADGLLTIWPNDDASGDGCTWVLAIGGLDPFDTVSGTQGRLDNLGYDAGDVDGISNPQTEAAVQEFQTDNALTVDGIAGPITHGKLKELHGC